MITYRALKKMYYRVLSPKLELCLQSARYKFCNLTSFIRLRRKIKNINNISLKFIMLTDNNQISRNCFVIIYCHLRKVSSQINKCIIFEPNELYITLSTLWCTASLRMVDVFIEVSTQPHSEIIEGTYLFQLQYTINI